MQDSTLIKALERTKSLNPHSQFLHRRPHISNLTSIATLPKPYPCLKNPPVLNRKRFALSLGQS